MRLCLCLWGGGAGEAKRASEHPCRHQHARAPCTPCSHASPLSLPPSLPCDVSPHATGGLAPPLFVHTSQPGGAADPRLGESGVEAEWGRRVAEVFRGQIGVVQRYDDPDPGGWRGCSVCLWVLLCMWQERLSDRGGAALQWHPTLVGGVALSLPCIGPWLPGRSLAGFWAQRSACCARSRAPTSTP